MSKEYQCMYNDYTCPYYDKDSNTCHMQIKEPYTYPPEDCEECVISDYMV